MDSLSPLVNMSACPLKDPPVKWTSLGVSIRLRMPSTALSS